MNGLQISELPPSWQSCEIVREVLMMSCDCHVIQFSQMPLFVLFAFEYEDVILKTENISDCTVNPQISTCNCKNGQNIDYMFSL